LSVDIRVRGYHLDVYQHVNNGRYMEFLEEARWDFMGKTGFTEQLEALGRALVVVNININYRRPALLDDLLRVTVRLSKIGNKSAQFEQVVTRIVDGEEQDVVADAMVTFCVMDPDAEKAVVLAGELRSILEKAMEY
jgi:thioesterase-3